MRPTPPSPPFALLSALVAAVLVSAPSISTGASTRQSPPQTGDANGDLEAAALDLQVVLGERDGDYAGARARLRATPGATVREIQSRLSDGTLDPAQRRRALHLWVEMAPQDAGDTIGQELAQALRTGQDAQPWMQLIRRLPDRGAAVLLGLVGDRTLTDDVRAGLLEPLIAYTPTPEQFVPLVGASSGALERTLRRGLRSRANTDRSARTALLAALDTRIGEPVPAPAAILLRAAIDPGGAVFRERAVTLAVDPDLEFPVRVAALIALAHEPQDVAAIRDLARAQLVEARRESTSSRWLGAFALDALPEPAARDIVMSLELLEARDPTLQAAALRVATLDAEGAWFMRAADSPWPAVRLAAIERVVAPCGTAIAERLTALALRTVAEDPSAPQVARAAIRALPRCPATASATLGELAGRDDAPGWARAAALTELLKLDPTRVSPASRLLNANDATTVEATLEAIRVLDTPPPPLVEAVCKLSTGRVELRAAARRTLRTWDAASRCATP